MPPSTNRQPSGRYWVTWIDRYAPNSMNEDDLDAMFRDKAKEFIAALKAAHATVKVRHTRRTEQASYLWHWAWKIAKRRCAPKDAKPYSKSPPIPNIQWDHGNLAKSIKGAQEMVDGFNLVHEPSLNSRHIPGLAIDMNITWTGTIKVRKKDGSNASIPYMINVNANTALHDVGESYGVKKLKTDKPHWSIDGH